MPICMCDPLTKKSIHRKACKWEIVLSPPVLWSYQYSRSSDPCLLKKFAMLELLIVAPFLKMQHASDKKPDPRTDERRVDEGDALRILAVPIWVSIILCSVHSSKSLDAESALLVVVSCLLVHPYLEHFPCPATTWRLSSPFSCNPCNTGD